MPPGYIGAPVPVARVAPNARLHIGARHVMGVGRVAGVAPRVAHGGAH